ncbi:MAG: helix-hairpin-helix domain-containing protein, partial [Planctomycetes bacterium]|nr:helix-hairpin-helix domain-containing protein [Planctomycetota bacterium]
RPFPLPLDLNSASAAQLDLLPSVGPRTAERIVADRERNGPFRSPADVRRVPGLPRRAAERISRLAVAR